MMYHVSDAFQHFGNDSQITKNTASLFYLSVLHLVVCCCLFGGRSYACMQVFVVVLL